MKPFSRGIVGLIAFLLLGLFNFTVNGTDIFFDVQTVFTTQSPYSTNRVFRIQALSPFPGSFFYRTSDVAGQFYVSNTLATTYSGQMLAPPNSVTFSFYVSSTNLGVVPAQQITSIPANGVNTFPAGQTAYSAQASDQRYQFNTNAASQVFYPLGSNPSNYVNLVVLQATNTALTNLVFVTSNSLASQIGSAGISALVATNISSNQVWGATNVLSSLAYSNPITIATTNLVFVTSNSLQSQIGSAGISAATATNISTNQVFLGTNNIGIGSGLSAFVSTNRFDTNGAGLAYSTLATNGLGNMAFRTTNAFVVTIGAAPQIGEFAQLVSSNVIKGSGYTTSSFPLAVQGVMSELTVNSNINSSGVALTVGGIANFNGLVNMAGAVSVDAVNAFTNTFGGALTILGINVQEGDSTVSSSASSSHAEGESSSVTGGTGNHAEGDGSTASGLGTHAEGEGTTSSGSASHAEGFGPVASGLASHAEGFSTLASGTSSHAAGASAKATNNNSYVWSDGTTVGSGTNKTFTVFAANGINLSGGVVTGNGGALTNTTATNLVGGALSQITNIASSVTTTSAGITNAYGTNFPNGLVTGQRIYYPTNFDALGGSNFLFGVQGTSSNFLYATKMDETNGTSYGQFATNFTMQGNVAFGQATNILWGTNFIAFYNSGSPVATNGSFVWNNTLSAYTNWSNGSILTNTGSSWLYQTNGVTLYSISGSVPVGQYSQVSGATPAPVGFYTAAINDHMVLLGYFSVSNLNQLFSNASNYTVAVAANYMLNNNGFGTNGRLFSSRLLADFGEKSLAGNGLGQSMDFQEAAFGQANTNSSSGLGAAILSGATNLLNSDGSGVIAGGIRNVMQGGSGNADVIVGGAYNSLVGSAGISSIDANFIGAGMSNSVVNVSAFSFLGGGFGNSTKGGYDSIIGGRFNTNTVDGGVILGGSSNNVSGSWSIASGQNAQAANSSVFIWSDGTPVSSGTNNQFVIVATNGLNVLVGGITMTNLNPGAAVMALGVMANGQFTTNGVPGGSGGGQTAAQVAAQIKSTNDNITVPTITSKVATLSNSIPIGVSLKAFGAVGDGVTDDTTAVQNWANFICSTNVMGIVTPASGAGYVITSAIGFSNTCQIAAQGGGVNYGASDFALTKCKFIQTTRGVGGFYFTNYADALDLSKITIVNSQPGNFTNANSYGFYFTGAVGSHMNMFTQLGVTNFGKGYYPVDLATATFRSCAGQYNGTGFEVTNINAFDFPIKMEGCVFSLNYSNQVSCSSATVQSFIVENSIIFAATPAHNFYSVANNTTLIGDSLAAFTTNSSIEIGGGTANIIGTTIIAAGGNPLAGRYAIAATNCNLNIYSQLDSSNSLNNASTYLYGASSKLLASPATDAVYNNGGGVITTNRAANALSWSFNGGSGTGIVLPPNALGVLTNNGSGSTNWSTSISGAWIGIKSLPSTVADTSWMPITNAVAYSNSTGIPVIGNALVITGTNAYGAILVAPTNFPSGGGSTPNNLVTNGGAVSVVVPSPFYITNNSGAVAGHSLLFEQVGTSLPLGLQATGIQIASKTNGVTTVKSDFSADYFVSLLGGGYFVDNGFVWQTNGVRATSFLLDSNTIVHLYTNGTETITLDSASGTITGASLVANGGTVNVIATNAAPVFASSGLVGALPFGLTNTLAGRAQYLVGYYRVDAVGGTPILTVSNEFDGYKYPIISAGASASITPETNWFVTPILTTNTVLRVRDESTGSGASVGIISSRQIGL